MATTLGISHMLNGQSMPCCIAYVLQTGAVSFVHNEQGLTWQIYNAFSMC